MKVGKIMRIQICFLIVLLFLFSSFSWAQNVSDNSDSNLTDIKQTTKFDNFGDISEKEFVPKLKKFINLLRKSDSLQGYVVFYNSFNDTSFKQTNYFAQRKTRNYSMYLSNEWLNQPRITYILGGLREKITTELWLVPVGGERPQITNSGELAKGERYKLEILGTERIDLYEAKLKKEVKENEDSDDNESELKLETESNSKDFTKELTEVLSRDKTWRAVLIFYADKDEYDIQKSRQKIESLLQPYVKTSNLDLNHVKIIYGGYRANPEIESWIVNKNGIEPEPMPDEKLEEEI
jgi:hypothetical protein